MDPIVDQGHTVITCEEEHVLSSSALEANILRSKSGQVKTADIQSLNKALEAVTAPHGIRMSRLQASRIYNVKYKTLNRYITAFYDSGAEWNVKYYDIKKVFTDEDEIKLVNYIKKVANMSYSLPKQMVRKLCYKFAVANKKYYPFTWDVRKLATEEWTELFLNRHSDEIEIGCKLNKTVDIFFDNLEDIHKRFGPLPPERIWNQGEIIALTNLNCKFVTVYACVNAKGFHIPPMLVYPTGNFGDFMLEGAPQGTLGAVSYMSIPDETTHLEFMEHFIKCTKPSIEEPVLLIMNNCRSHHSVELINLATNAGVVILTVPPHRLKNVQPIELGVHFPFDKIYWQGVKAWSAKNSGKIFDVFSVAEIVGQTYPQVFTPSNIINGFQKSGIYPPDKSLMQKNLSHSR